jgi:hypothetical protein
VKTIWRCGNKFSFIFNLGRGRMASLLASKYTTLTIYWKGSWVSTWAYVKLKFTLEKFMKAQRVCRIIALFFLWPRHYMCLGGQSYASAAWRPGKTRYPLYGRLGGPQGLSGQVCNILSLVFDPRAVQPVANRYTISAIPAHPQSLWFCSGRKNSVLVCSWNCDRPINSQLLCLSCYIR